MESSLRDQEAKAPGVRVPPTHCFAYSQHSLSDIGNHRTAEEQMR